MYKIMTEQDFTYEMIKGGSDISEENLKLLFAFLIEREECESYYSQESKRAGELFDREWNCRVFEEMSITEAKEKFIETEELNLVDEIIEEISEITDIFKVSEDRVILRNEF